MTKDIYILGVSMSNHDRSACLMKNGLIICAIAEERLDRRKKSEGFYGINDRKIVLPPMAAITYVLRYADIELDRIDLLVCGRSISLCRNAILTYLPINKDRIIEPPIPGHHLAHAYSAYGTSPFPASAVLVIDEQGHNTSNGRFEKCSWYEGTIGKLTPLYGFEGDIKNDLSLGMFYDAFAALTGLSEAGKPSASKLMGLASLGKKRSSWPELISLDLLNGNTLISLEKLDTFFELAGMPIRAGMNDFKIKQLDELLLKYYPIYWGSELASDLAYKAQCEIERAILHICHTFRQKSSYDTLCYAGGVALNCIANKKILETGWSDIYIHPASTDDGIAVGLAIYGWIEVLGNTRKLIELFNPFKGNWYTKNDINEALTAFGIQDFARNVNPSKEGANRLANGEIICWFQGRSEWGPRALGARSIVANPLISGIKKKINSTIKYRESFRPFGISIIADKVKEMIDISNSPAALGPYMLTLGQLINSRLSEVSHFDKTVRYQTVHPSIQSTWYELIDKFGEITGIFAVLNTSFNTMGEPIVETPMDAVRQFLISGADALLIEDTLITISEIPKQVINNACRLAWTLTPIDPLQMALSLEAAGYPEAALNLLAQMEYTSESAISEGSSAVRSFHGLLQRIIFKSGDIKTTYHHAEMVLQWSTLSLEAARVAKFLAECPSLDKKTQSIGQLISMISSQGGAFKFFKSMLEQNS